MPSIGRPIPGAQTFVLDDSLMPVPVGVVGTLYAGGAGLARGYRGRPDLTAAAFLTDQVRLAPRLYCTGDLARYRQDGSIEVIGRIDRQVKLRGHRIEPGDIEAHLRAHPRVQQAAVVVVGQGDDRRLVAHVAVDGEPLADKEVRAFLTGRLPSYMVPSAVVCSAALPLTEGGKVDLRALTAAVQGPASPEPSPSVAPRDATEAAVAAIWQDVLSAPALGAEDDFFRSGGHSLLAMRVVSRVNETFGIDLPLRTMFDASTVAAFASMVRAEVLVGRTSPATGIPRRPDDEPPPLSYAQERIWFMEQYAPGTAAYNVPLAFRLRGRVRAGALSAAVRTIGDRHEALRTSFLSDADGGPICVVHPKTRLMVKTAFADEGSPAEVADAVSGLVRDALTTPFKLPTDALIRFVLIEIADDEHVLVIAAHHIVFDGWSVQLLMSEVETAYRAERSGVAAVFEPLPVQYGDYAAWERARVASQADADLDYWNEQLADVPPLDLTTDRPRPARQTYAGSAVPLRIDQQTAQRCRELAADQQGTLFMVLLAALQITLARSAVQDDFAIGTPVSSRRLPEQQQLIGVFLNMLAIRADLAGDPSFAELLTRARGNVLDAFAHQDVPFERVVQALGVPRDLSRSPVFQVILAVQEVAQELTRFADLEVDPYDFEAPATRFDLELHVREALDGGLEGHLVHNSDLWDEASSARLVSTFTTILSAAVTDPARPVRELPMLDSVQRDRIVQEWNDTAGPFPDDTTLDRLIQQQVSATPDAIAVALGTEALTYAELGRRAGALEAHLRAAGVGVGSVVAVLSGRCCDLVAGLYAVLRCGAAYLPVDPKYPQERIDFMLTDCDVKVALVEPGRSPAISHDIAALSLDLHTQPAPVVDPAAATAGPDDIAYVIYTSGSTGRPKGVANTHRGICNRLDWMQRTYELGADDIVLQKTPTTFDVSVWEFFWPLLSGARLALAKPGGEKDPAYLRDLIVDAGVTTMHFVPSMLAIFLEEEDLERCTSLRRLICSGEELTPTLAERCLARLPGELHNLYGPTEAAIDVSAWHCRRAELPGRTVLPIGRPIQNTPLYVLDERLAPVPVGVPGELHIGGVGLARGYVNRPELTRERFVADPFGGAGARLYKTGDRARYRDDGTIEYLGRLDSQVKLRGMRIELGEVEHALRRQPGVREAVVTAYGKEIDQQLVGYLVADDVDTDELRRGLRGFLPDYMVPSTFVVLDALPLGGTGKVNRAALPAPVQRREIEQAPQLPQSPVEQTLLDIMRVVLGQPEIGTEDDFFALGGHSLQAARVVSQAKRMLPAGSRPLSVMDLFANPTIRGLAALVDGDEAPAGERLLYELTKGRSAAATELSLVCIPEGGGSAAAFQSLADVLPASHRLYAASLPGHDPGDPGTGPQPVSAVAPALVAAIGEQVQGSITLYGHCVNSALTVEVARLLESSGRALEAVYVGGSFPSARIPGRFFDLVARVLPFDRLSGDRSFSTFLRSIGGEADFAAGSELSFHVGNLRHDFRQGEDYFTEELRHARKRLTAPIISVVAEMDPLTDFYEERYLEWQAFSERVGLAVLPGGNHFFPKQQAAPLAEILTAPVAAHYGPAAAISRPSPSYLRAARAGPPVGLRTSSSAPMSRPSLRPFAVVALGQLMSSVGSALTAFVLGVWVYITTGSIGQFSAVAVAGLLPGVLLSPVAGAVVDRYDRRLVMLAADMAALAAIGSLGLIAVFGDPALWHIVVATTAVSVAAAFHRPAYNSAIPQLLPKSMLGHANGFVAAAQAVGIVVAPLAGIGLLTAFGLRWVLVIDAASYLIAALTLALVRFPRAMPWMSRDPFTVEVVGGMRYLMSTRSFRTILGYFAIGNFLDAVLIVLMTPMVLSFATQATLGTVMLVGGLGALAGGITMGLWGGPRRYITGVLGASLVADLAMMLTGLRPSVVLVSAGFFLWSFSLPLIVGCYNSIIQIKVPTHLQGRIFAFNQMFALSAMPLGFVLAGPLASVARPLLADGGALAGSFGKVLGVGPDRGLGLLFLGAGVLLVAATVCARLYPPIWRIDDLVPDASDQSTDVDLPAADPAPERVRDLAGSRS